MKRVWGMLALALGLVSTAWAADGGLFHFNIIDRASDGWPFTKIYYAYVVSNLPQETVMPAVCRDALLVRHHNKAHCHYIPLAWVGRYGRKLLPFDPAESRELVVVVDRSTLTKVETEALAQLQQAYFPTHPAPATPQNVLLFLQNAGDTMKEYQVLVSLPAARWLTAAAEALWAVPLNDLPEGSLRTLTIEHGTGTTALLCNDTVTREALRTALPFHDVTTYDLPNLDAYLDSKPTQRIVALNWNGDAAITPAQAAQLLPVGLRATMAADAWAHFYREATAQRYLDDHGATWCITAPTARHLQALAQTVIANDFTGGPYRLPLVDLTTLQTPSVGIYAPPQEDGASGMDEGALQRGLEDQTAALLNVHVPTLADTPEWPDALAGALDPNPLAEAPFTNLPRVQKYATGDTLLLFWVKRARPTVTYAFPAERLATTYAEFDEPEPVCPVEPDPEEVIVVGTFRFPGSSHEGRMHSHEYGEAWRHWHDEELVRYEIAHRMWEERYAVWLHERRHYRAHYRYQVQATGGVEVTGYLRIIDLRTGKALTRTVDYTQHATGETKIVGAVPAWVDGDEIRPALPHALHDYTPADTWRDCERILGAPAMARLCQQALKATFTDALTHLADTALRAGDVKGWNKGG